MASLAAIFGDRRRLLLSAIIFAILAAFLLIYYFHYLPSNRNQLNDYGFRLLDRTILNIEERDTSQNRYFKAVVRNAKENDSWLLKRLASADGNEVDTNINALFACKDSVSNFGYSNIIRKWMRVYRIPKAQDSRQKQRVKNVGLAIEDLVAPCIKYRNELFTEYLVFATCDRTSIPVYQFPLEGLAGNTSIDSVIPHLNDNGMPGIVNVSYRGDPYHLFFVSFQLDRQEFILCGLIEQSDYEARASSISITVIKRFIMVVLVALISFPFIKIFFLSRGEQVKITDFVFLISTFFAGTAIITLIIIDTLLESANDLRTQKNLVVLSQQISSSFFFELEQARSVIDCAEEYVFGKGDFKAREDTLAADSAKLRTVGKGDSIVGKATFKAPKQLDTGKPDLPVIVNPLVLTKGKNKSKITSASGEKTINIEEIVKNISYTYFDRFAWADSTGLQTLKAQTDDPINMRFNQVQDRKYFRSIMANGDSADLGFEPLFSWTGTEFRIVISKHTNYENNAVVTLSTIMYSLVDVIMPAGYGYCLTDEKGNILTHSQTQRNLRENFLDETENLSVMREAMAARQSVTLDRIFLYGEPHAMHLTAIENSPLFLFTFYNRNFGFAASVRIISFVLVFTTIYFLLIIGLRVAIHPKRPGSVLQPSIDYFELTVPSRRKAVYFRISRWIFPTYGFILSSLAFIYPRLDDYPIIFLLIMTPINIIWLLYCIREWHLNTIEKSWLNQQMFTKSHTVHRIFAVSLFTILTLLVDGGAKFYEVDSRLLFLLFQVLVLVVGCTFLFLWIPAGKKNDALPLHSSNLKILRYFSQYLMGGVITISVLPICLFTWYAHNHELVQQVKKTQFTTATKYFEREQRLKPFFDSLGQYAYNSLPRQYNLTKGIYRIYNDKIEYKKDTIKNPTIDKSEQLYQNISSLISGEYADPVGIPSLEQHSSDYCWYFLKDEKKHTLVYNCEQSSVVNTNSNREFGLFIESFVDRYQIITNLKFVIPLIAIIILILYGIYRLMKSSMYRLLGYRYLSHYALNPNPGPLSAELFDGCVSRARSDYNQISTEMVRSKLQQEYDQHPFSSNFKVDQETEIIRKTESWAAFFECLWRKLSEEEKIVLADLAQDGLANYKQAETISTLQRKGLIVGIDCKLRLFSNSFRYFIVQKVLSPDGATIREKIQRKPSVSSIRTPILVALFLVGTFIFLTQEHTFQKVSGMITGLTTLIPLLLKFFSQQHESKN